MSHRDKADFIVGVRDGVNAEVFLDEHSRSPEVLARFKLDSRVVRDLLDECLRAHIAERFHKLGLGDTIDAAAGKRVDSMVDAFVKSVERDMGLIVREHMRNRIRSKIDTLPITIDVSIGEPPPPKEGVKEVHV